MEELRKRVSNLIYLSSILAIGYGAIFLVTYSVKEQFSLPLELSVLTLFLLVVGINIVISIIAALILFLISGYIRIFLVPKKYSDVFYVRGERFYYKENMFGLINYAWYFIFPIVLSDIVFNDDLLICMFVCILFLCAFLIYAVRIKGQLYTVDVKSKDKYFKIIKDAFVGCIPLVFIVCLGCISYKIFFAVVNVYTDDASIIFACLFFFFLFNFLIILPPKRELEQAIYERECKKTNKLFDLFFNNNPILATFIILTLLLAFYFTTVIGYSVLSNLKLGQVEKVFYYDKRDKISIPPDLIDFCDKDYCQTKPLFVLFDVSTVTYIKYELKGHNMTLSLPRKYLSSMYPRHDDKEQGSESKIVPKLDSNIKPQQ